MEKETIEMFIGHYGWMILAGFLFLIGRKTIESSIEAIKVFMGNDLNTDDVIIFDDRPARVVRVGLWKTILFIYEVGCVDGKPFVKGGTKIQIQNDKLKDHVIERPLQMLDLSKWEVPDASKDGD